jgi:glycosyltransferase involved in cell wall biosynthesis
MTNTVIVVPCHNEAQRLDVARFRQFVGEARGIRFLMVNDGSRDGTWGILERMAAADPQHFAAVNLPVNGGKAEAVRQGMLRATLDEPDFFGFWDADLATPLDAIGQYVSVLDRQPRVDLVMGVRLRLLGRSIRRRRLRSWMGRIFATAASLAFRQRMIDTQCGAKLFRYSPQTVAAFSQPFQSRWIFDVELIARMVHLRGGNGHTRLCDFVYELPLDEWEDVKGSNLKRSDFFRAAGEMGAIWWRYLRPGAPTFVPADLAKPTIRHDDVPKKAA